MGCAVVTQIFGAVKDSAQKSYAVGQWAVESLATIGPISVLSFVLIRYSFCD